MSGNDTKERGKVRFGISRKLLLSVVLLTLLICAISTVSGYYQYSNTIRKMYNDNGYAVANIILNNIDHDKIGHYAQTWTEDEDYAQIAEYLKDVAKASDVAFIYIVTLNEDQTIRYIFDSTGVPLGASDPVPANFDEAWEAYTEGKRLQFKIAMNDVVGIAELCGVMMDSTEETYLAFKFSYIDATDNTTYAASIETDMGETNAYALISYWSN